MSAQDEAAYRKALAARATLPSGFRTGRCEIGFRAHENGKRMDMALGLIVGDAPMSYGAMMTTNRVASVSVEHLRKMRGRGAIQGVLINNKIANVAVASGDDDYRRLQGELSSALGIPSRALVGLSTGIIGWRLPVREMVASFAGLREALQQTDCVGLAKAMMTTDRYPKVRSRTIGDGRIVGICKGAGMVEPMMATTFVIFLTDLTLNNRALRHILRGAMDDSFHALSVDGDQSTSDVALILSTNRYAVDSMRVCAQSCAEIASELAEDLVRGGEGVSHLVRIAVKGCKSRRQAIDVGRYILTSRLCATAIAGNDPNIGRVIARVGSYARHAKPSLHTHHLTVSLGGHVLYRNGAAMIHAESERALTAYLRERAWNPKTTNYPTAVPPVDMTVDLGIGNGRATVIGGDLTAEYAHINGDYRT